MSVRYHSSTDGYLYYNPTTLPSDITKSHRLFRPRRTGPGRIYIKSVDDVKTTAPDDRVLLFFSRSKKRLSFKVAVSRENAKRFLRSVIQNPNATDQQKELANSKRRSWSPVKRTDSGGANSGIAPPAETASNMRGAVRGSISGPINAHLARPRLHSDARNRSNSSAQSAQSGRPPNLKVSTASENSVIPALDLENERPVASGNGVSVGVHLADPVLFLQGFENNDHAPGNTVMLRGSLHIRVQKAAKIKAVSLKFKGRAMTKWPEGIPPRKIDFEEIDTIMSHTWPFFNAQFESAEKSTNADHVQLFNSSDGSSTSNNRLDPLGRSSPNPSQANLSSKEAKKLALSVNQSRSFGKGDPMPSGPGVAAKGYRTFMPGDYIYNFELPLDSRLPETIDVDLGSVKYELEATVERAGAFRANLIGTKQVTLIRAPAEGSLEQVEPIAISRNWEDQLHYDIVISGKSFPLGSQVPIAFKLTPLAKVQCHRIKVLVTENIEYFCSNKRVHRMEPTRKVQLFEKRADGPPTSTFPGSTMRITAGGGIPYDERARAARGEEVTPADPTNMLGDLAASDSGIGPTEMEFSVQLPSCHTMKERDRNMRLHFDTTYQNIQVHHWIKVSQRAYTEKAKVRMAANARWQQIVMRLSKPDAQDSTKRRHFEISIDSPFHILSCRATQANISLPAYSSPEAPPNPSTNSSVFECGCPGAARRRHSPTYVPTLHSLQANGGASDPSDDRANTPSIQSPGLTRPPTVHLSGPQQPGQRPSSHQHTPSAPASLQRPDAPRPMHLLRAPSFNPPAFDDSEPPPPMITPPPDYGDIASPTSGLADYFARLSDAYEEEDEDVGRGRVNVPLTPGGRINRSMDMRRTWLPVGGAN